MAFELGPALGFIRPIDFFPPRPDLRDGRWEGALCVATKSRALGDALMLTTLPAKLRARGLRVVTYPRGFNPVVFRGNPAVSGVTRFPRSIHGDDCNWGEGHLIQLKERFFDLPVSAAARPEIHLTEAERAWARAYVADRHIPLSAEQSGDADPRPLVILHPWGKTASPVAHVDFWDALVARWKSRVRFWQVGIEGHGAVVGCEFYYWAPNRPWGARQLFAITERARAFVGVDSGPMHVAAAFAKPSFVLLPPGRPDPARAFDQRATRPYYLSQREDGGFLYAQNEHGFAESAGARLDAFLERVSGG